MRAVLLAFLVASAARGADPVYEAPTPPPAVYGPLVWRSNGVDAHGWWSTDAAIQKLQVRLDYLENKATKDCIQTTNAETKATLGSKPTMWIVAGAALLVGIAGGVYAAKKL